MAKNLGVPAICRIIETCAKYGVASLKCGDFELSFPNRSTSSMGLAEAMDLSKTLLQTESQESVSQSGPEMTPIDPEILEEARRAQLLIDDPLSFETLMIDEQVRRPDAEAEH